MGNLYIYFWERSWGYILRKWGDSATQHLHFEIPLAENVFHLGSQAPYPMWMLPVDMPKYPETSPLMVGPTDYQI